MIRAFFISLTLTIVGSPVFAACLDGPMLFSCTFSHGKKSVHVCQSGTDYTYAYGRIGRAPDLFLQRSLGELDFTPWPGIGRTYWEEVQFKNKSVTYQISFTVDRMSGDRAIAEGQLAVLEGENRLALLICDEASVRTNFTPLANAWHDAGLQ